jgi:hypothetical protein
MLRVATDVRYISWSGDTMSFDFTVTGDANSVLLVGILLSKDGAVPNPISSVTFNGNAVAILNYAQYGNAFSGAYRKIAPTAGLHTLTITRSPGVTAEGMVAVYQVKDVHQTTPEYDVQAYHNEYPGQTGRDLAVGSNAGGIAFDFTNMRAATGVSPRNSATAISVTAEYWGGAGFTQKLEATQLGYNWGDWTCTVFASVIVALRPVAGGGGATNYWQVPTNAADGTVRELVILSTDRLTVVDKGAVTAAAGVFSRVAADQGIAAGTKKLAFIHEWDGTTTDASIYGGAAIATVVAV